MGTSVMRGLWCRTEILFTSCHARGEKDYLGDKNDTREKNDTSGRKKEYLHPLFKGSFM